MIDEIAAAQLRIPRRPIILRERVDYRRVARWWELEARRGYASASTSLGYAHDMRWAAELAGEHGPHTWLELVALARASSIHRSPK